MVSNHIEDLKLLNGDHLIALGIRLRHFEVKISSLPLDLQMGLRNGTGAPSFASLLAAAFQAFFAPECVLRCARETWVLSGVAFAIGEEALETNINTNAGMLTRDWKMGGVGFHFTSDENVPVSIRTTEQVGCPGYSFQGAMELDLDEASQLLWNQQVFAIGGKGKVRLVLAQLDGVPSVRCLETRETSLEAQFPSGKEPFECLREPISKHLDNGCRNMISTTPFEGGGEIILGGKRSLFLILLLHQGKHLIVDAPCFDEASQEQVLLFLLGIKAILKCSHEDIFLYASNIVKRAFHPQTLSLGALRHVW